MRAVIQRVLQAHVDVVTDAGERIRTGEIGPGLCVLVGVTHSDRVDDAHALADKVWRIRLFADDDATMNRSLSDRAERGEVAAVVVVSQFTLYADTTKGRRPSWSAAARPEHAAPLIDAFTQRLAAAGATVAVGRFGADMQVGLINDGPATVVVEVPATKRRW